jgi:hypothetical protein
MSGTRRWLAVQVERLDRRALEVEDLDVSEPSAVSVMPGW